MGTSRILWVGLSLALGVASPAWAQQAPAPKPVPVSDFPVATVERLGLEMFLHDQMAWRATDALTDGKFDIKGLKGWVVIDRRPGFQVRFIRETTGGLEAAYDVVFDADMKPRVIRPTDTHLSETETAQFAATVTARTDVPSYCVQEPYNTIVLPNPGGDGWLVWLLQPMTKADTYPITGHWRYLVSQDGKTIIRRDKLGNTCLSMKKEKNGVAMMVTNIVSEAPLETHVFTNYASKQDVYVATGKDTLWRVHEGEIATIDTRTMQPKKR